MPGIQQYSCFVGCLRSSSTEQIRQCRRDPIYKRRKRRKFGSVSIKYLKYQNFGHTMIPFSFASSLALSPYPDRSKKSTSSLSSLVLLHRSYDSSTRLGMLYRSFKCDILFLDCSCSCFSSSCSVSIFRFKPCIRLII